MSDDDQPVSDAELTALLRTVSDDPTLEPPSRDRVRDAMFAEFDAVAGDFVSSDSRELPSMVLIEPEEDRSRPRRRPSISAWLAAAAACVVVLALFGVASLRNEPSEYDAGVPASPTTVSGVDEPAAFLDTVSPRSVLDDTTYRTDEILDGVSFEGAAGLRLVALRPGLIVMDSVSEGGDLLARFSLFEADQREIREVIDTASEDGRLRVESLQFTAGGRSLPREDLTVTSDGVADFGCTARTECLPLVAPIDDRDPSVWAPGENSLVEVKTADPSVFALVQSTSFPNPLLSQAFEIIESLRFE